MVLRSRDTVRIRGNYSLLCNYVVIYYLITGQSWKLTTTNLHKASASHRRSFPLLATLSILVGQTPNWENAFGLSESLIRPRGRNRVTNPFQEERDSSTSSWKSYFLSRLRLRLVESAPISHLSSSVTRSSLLIEEKHLSITSVSPTCRQP